jgi:hypothetical protein
MLITDLDAAVDLGEGFAGSKFSSGVLPPEMFVKLDLEGVQRFEAYWQHEKEEDGAVWTKVRPMVGEDGSTYVVRCFDSSKPSEGTECTRQQHKHNHNVFESDSIELFY